MAAQRGDGVHVLKARKGLQSSPSQPKTLSGFKINSALEALVFTVILNLLVVWFPSRWWRTRLPPSPLHQPRLWSPCERSEVPSWQGKTGVYLLCVSKCREQMWREGEEGVSYQRGHSAGAQRSPRWLQAQLYAHSSPFGYRDKMPFDATETSRP